MDQNGFSIHDRAFLSSLAATYSLPLENRVYEFGVKNKSLRFIGKFADIPIQSFEALSECHNILDNSGHLIFIGSHDLDNMGEHLPICYSKLRVGGLLVGDGIKNPNIRKIVHNFVVDLKLKLFSKDNLWYTQKI